MQTIEEVRNYRDSNKKIRDRGQRLFDPETIEKIKFDVEYDEDDRLVDFT